MTPSDMVALAARDLDILQHSLGLDEYGRGKAYRNHFVAGPGHHSFDACRSLAERGLMIDHGPRGELTGGDNLFTVTDAGQRAVREQSPPPPKLTRGQRRYAEYLEVSDHFESFGDFLRYRHEQTRGGYAL